MLAPSKTKGVSPNNPKTVAAEAGSANNSSKSTGKRPIWGQGGDEEKKLYGGFDLIFPFNEACVTACEAVQNVPFPPLV